MMSLSHWNMIGYVLEFLSIRPLLLPLSPHDVFVSEQWLSGNIASLCPYIDINNNDNCIINNSNYNNLDNIIDKNQSHENISDEYLIIYLELLTYFYSNFDVPGVIKGIKGIVWKKQVIHFHH